MKMRGSGQEGLSAAPAAAPLSSCTPLAQSWGSRSAGRGSSQIRPVTSGAAGTPCRRKEVVMATAEASPRHYSHQAYQILHFGFVVAPILAGLDKFFNLLTNWEKYLAPFV